MSQSSLTKSYTLLLALSVIWGLAFVAIRRADRDLSPVSLTLLRWLIVSAAFLVLAPFIGKLKVPFQRTDLPRFLVVALSNVVIYHLSLNYAESIVSASLAGFLISLGPVFVVLLSRLSLGEKIGRRLVTALLFALAGALILSAGDNLSFVTLTGPVAVVVTALAYAVYAVLSKPLVGKYGAVPTAIWASIAGTAMLLPLLSGSFFADVSRLSTEGWVSVLYLALLSTVIGNTIFYTLVGRKAVSTLSIQLYLIPLVSALGGVILLGEAITLYLVFGGAALLVAVALATGTRPPR
ncbi:MAG: DMT family transporter [Thaumarchaeota archaeon]|nr:MAG: DMT family transporter [Nitrososphaerota archaeon]